MVAEGATKTDPKAEGLVQPYMIEISNFEIYHSLNNVVFSNSNGWLTRNLHFTVLLCIFVVDSETESMKNFRICKDLFQKKGGVVILTNRAAAQAGNEKNEGTYLSKPFT